MTSIDSFSPLSQKLDWIKAWQKGASYSKAVDGFNMPVVALSNGQIDGVAKKNKTDDGTKKKAADTNTQYEPLIQIEGSTFETEAKKWHDTFPKSYPKDLTALDKAQVKGHIDITSNTSTTWQDFGYSKTTTTSGSSGWIFWSDSTTTVTESTTSSIETNVSDFTGGVDIRIWGLNRYPVMYGE